MHSFDTRNQPDALDLFQRSYRSLLRSSGEIQIEALIEPYLAVEPLLHVHARDPQLDAAALVYSSLRLPNCIDHVRLLLFGQSHEVFAQHGYGNVTSWQPVSSPGRRRKMFYDGNETLAVLIASPSDLDDLIPILLALQIEWNKAYQRLHELAHRADLTDTHALLNALGLSAEDQLRLRVVWASMLDTRLDMFRKHRKRFAVRMLGGAYMDYQRATLRWWWHIEKETPQDLTQHPVYFVSSNTHSMVNLLSGFALRNTDELLAFCREREHTSLLDEYEKIMSTQVPSSRENFFYYVLKKYQSDPGSATFFAQRLAEEQQAGIQRIPSRLYIDVDTQVIEIAKLRPECIDPRLRVEGLELLSNSDAFIVNIDYPLGLAAYQILTIVARSVGCLLGVYVLGKAATLNGKIGDVLIPNVVYDDHSDNIYQFASAFRAADVEPYLSYGAVLDNQKAVTVRGTFLQNRAFLDMLYRNFYTDMEMEAGPFLSAIYEQSFPDRTPQGQNISFFNPPYDIGFLHYASDTPASKGHNLGSQNMSYFGMDPTYATALACARRILSLEVARMRK